MTGLLLSSNICLQHE